MTVRIGVHGACGRMGQRIVALAHADGEAAVGAAVESVGHPWLGRDAGEVAGIGKIGVLVGTLDAVGPGGRPLTPRGAECEAEGLDVMIDFSVPEAAAALARWCAERRVALVSATTGLSEMQRRALRSAAERIALLSAPNMSLAVNLLMKLTARAAEALRHNPDGVDVEIVERHHRFKEDAPSGTALRFGEIVAEIMGQTSRVHGRQGRPGKRPPEEIGFHALRTGDNVGEHTIVFGLMGETLELTHRAHTRDCYARGAIAAAKFLAGKPPGSYTMFDVLGL